MKNHIYVYEDEWERFIEGIKKQMRRSLRDVLRFWLFTGGAAFLAGISALVRYLMGYHVALRDCSIIFCCSFMGAVIFLFIEEIKDDIDLLSRVRITKRPPALETILTRKSWYRRKEQVKHRDKAICQYCGKYAPEGHVDHIMPLSKGGTDDLRNLIWACEGCNLQKGARLL